MTFDHEKLDVYRIALQFVAWSSPLCLRLTGVNRPARDQLLRSSQSIPQNIAEGNGKRSLLDRQRFFEIARGSALESAASLDILVVCQAISAEEAQAGKRMLQRIVAMLTRMTERESQIREESATYAFADDYDHEHEHRSAEHGHD
jgi:four helix bundle protein